MVKLPAEQKYELMGKIHAGIPLRQLMKKTGVAYPKLLALKKELKAARENGTLHDILNIEDVVLARVAEEVNRDAEAMGIREEIEHEVANATDGIQQMQLLDRQLRTTAMNIATKLNRLAVEADKASDLAYIGEAVCKLQTAFFNKGTQVNIQNNLNGEETKFKRFLQD